MKLLMRGYDCNGALVEAFTREIEVTQPGDGLYNVPTCEPWGQQVATVTVSVVV